jgi:hypothetical protein
VAETVVKDETLHKNQSFNMKNSADVGGGVMSSIHSIASVIARNIGNIQIPKVHSKMNNPRMNTSFSNSTE